MVLLTLAPYSQSPQPQPLVRSGITPNITPIKDYREIKSLYVPRNLPPPDPGPASPGVSFPGVDPPAALHKLNFSLPRLHQDLKSHAYVEAR